MGNMLAAIAAMLAAFVVGILALTAGVFVLIKGVQLVWRVVAAMFSIAGGLLVDSLRVVFAVLAAVVFGGLWAVNAAVGSRRKAGHFGREAVRECVAAGQCVYRGVLQRPLRALGLGQVLEGLEKRVPQVLASAPEDTMTGPVGRFVRAGSDTSRTRLFEGYTVVGTLAGGGSGAKLYVAVPDPERRAALERVAGGAVDQVVIKAFTLGDGSSLPQIVRESRSLDAAKKLGLVLEHELGSTRFFYVMRYIAGDSLGALTPKLHFASREPDGLDTPRLREALGYIAGLLETLDQYHRGGLWHKDVKPDNIIVTRDGSAHLVDFGLVTPLRSAMTLTTHGTEYFRDPELVRQALRGARVSDIDGSRFDVYAAGAVLYSLIENSFPAHGGLSRMTKRCPEAVRWIVRRSMTDYDKRYTSARAMLEDVRAVLAATEPGAVRPAQLPSFRHADDEPEAPAVPLEGQEFVMGRDAVVGRSVRRSRGRGRTGAAVSGRRRGGVTAPAARGWGRVAGATAGVLGVAGVALVALQGLRREWPAVPRPIEAGPDGAGPDGAGPLAGALGAGGLDGERLAALAMNLTARASEPGALLVVSDYQEPLPAEITTEMTTLVRMLRMQGVDVRGRFTGELAVEDTAAIMAARRLLPIDSPELVSSVAPALERLDGVGSVLIVAPASDGDAASVSFVVVSDGGRQAGGVRPLEGFSEGVVELVQELSLVRVPMLPGGAMAPELALGVVSASEALAWEQQALRQLALSGVPAMWLAGPGAMEAFAFEPGLAAEFERVESMDSREMADLFRQMADAIEFDDRASAVARSVVRSARERVEQRIEGSRSTADELLSAMMSAAGRVGEALRAASEAQSQLLLEGPAGVDARPVTQGEPVRPDDRGGS